MSRTQVDLSPLIIDRTQDITHWLEGDVTGLSTRDKQRYQRRKTAIEDYFKTELSVEKLSTRYRLSAEEESLEEMARRCFMLHEDGQPWGFRALVPGVKVMDHITTSEAAFSDSIDVLCDEVQVLSPDVVAGEAFENEDTAKRQALKPATPSGGEEEYEQTVIAKTELLEIEAVSETEDVQKDEGAKSIQEYEEALLVAVSEEEGVVVTGEVEVPTETNASLDEPLEPHQAEDQSIEMAAQIEPAECELATSADVIIDPPEQSVEEAEDTNVPTTKLSELDAPSDVTEQAAEVVEVAAEQLEEELVEAGVEQAEQTDTPVESSEDVSAEANTVLEPVEVPAEEIEEELVASVSEQCAEEIEEKTIASVSEQHTEEMEEEEAVEVTNGCTEVLEEDVAEVEEDTQELKAAGGEALAESAKALEEETPEFEQEESDVEEERRGRVAAASTIVVPSVMLEALERAEKQAILEETETVETSAVASNQVTEKPEQLVTPSAQETEGKEQSASPDEPTVEMQSRANGQLNVLQLLKTPIRSLAGESRFQISGSQAALRHLVRRHWIKQGKRKLQQRWVKIVSAAVIVTILVLLLVPLGVGLVGYNTYTNIRSVANDGLSHLMALKNLIPADKSDITSALNSKQLADAKVELGKAQDDFLQLQEMVNRPDIQSLLQQFAPQYSSKLGMARHLVQVALDVSYMGQELIGVAQLGANLMHAGSLFASNKPLIGANDINSIEAALVHGQYYINDIQAQMSQVDLAQLPFGSATQKAQLSRYLKMIPQVQGMIEQVQGLIGPVSWLLGVGQPRHLLVQ
ncbi:MAG TPA: hypothetical protein VFV38_07555, partial [Ktedonobacteraceae bacterium]|nr:hypothetical protein [Ktedonobacteraceae bacterium]